MLEDGQNNELLNTRKHLMHNGNWVSAMYVVGRKLPWTGFHTCCGNTEHFSLYCADLRARVEFSHLLYDHNEEMRLAPIKLAAGKKRQEEWREDKRLAAEKKKRIGRGEEEKKGGMGEVSSAVASIAAAKAQYEDEEEDERNDKHFFMKDDWKRARGLPVKEVKKEFSEEFGSDENALFEMRMAKVKPSDISMVVATMKRNPENHVSFAFPLLFVYSNSHRNIF
jgi:hypothetical protein